MDWLTEYSRPMLNLEPSFAASIGRPELARRALRLLPAGTSTSDRDSGLASQGAADQLAKAGASASAASVGLLNGGTLTGGTLALITIGLVGFYLWTRGHQA